MALEHLRAGPAGESGAKEESGRNTLSRVRHIIDRVELDGDCRVTLDNALDRFGAIEMVRSRSDVLRDARRVKAGIGTLLELLADLDEVTDTEADRSVFKELALLFDSLAEEAKFAAGLLRRLEEI